MKTKGKEEKVEKTENEKIKGKKKLILIIVLALVAVIAIGLGLFFVFRAKKSENSRGQMSSPPQMEGMGENVISASGLTFVGMSEETLDFDFLETALYVKESYLATGDEVTAGTVVFEVSEETLEEARKELKDKVTETSLAYRQGLLDYETDSIEAKVTYETAGVNQKYAQAEYDSAVSQAASKVEELTGQVEDARELVEEYEKSISEDYYRSYYKVDELYNTYYEHFSLLMEKYEEWDIEELEDQYGNSVSGLSGSSSGSSSGGSSTGSSQGGSSTGISGFKTASTSSLSAKNTVLTLSAVSSYAGDLITLNTEDGTDEDSDDSSDEDDTSDDSSDDSSEDDTSDEEDSEDDGSSEDDSNSDDGNAEESGGNQGGNGTGGNMPSSDGSQMPEGMSGNGGFGGGMSSMQSSGLSEESQKLSVYNLLDELVQQESQTYKTALENYETARDQASAGIEEARSNLQTLEAELVQAQTDYEKELILCKADYDTTIAESENSLTV